MNPNSLSYSLYLKLKEENEKLKTEVNQLFADNRELVEYLRSCNGLLAGIYAGENYKGNNPEIEQEIYRFNDIVLLHK